MADFERKSAIPDRRNDYATSDRLLDARPGKGFATPVSMQSSQTYVISLLIDGPDRKQKLQWGPIKGAYDMFHLSFWPITLVVISLLSMIHPLYAACAFVAFFAVWALGSALTVPPGPGRD